MNIDDILYESNLAEKMDKQKLIDIGKKAYEGYTSDKGSRTELEKMWEHWTRIALQVVEQKTYPWNNASNVKYPLLSTAAMQFAARAYPTLVPSNGQVVKCKVIGNDPDGSKTERAERVGKYMSYQVMDEMYEWEEEMDKLLITLPILGTVFKKTYYDRTKGRNKSCLVLPANLVVNYWAKNLCDCERVTEIIPMSARVLKERQLAGIFLDVELGDPQLDASNLDKVKTYGLLAPEVDSTTPYLILEQHTYLDLDDDGYPEPYVITFEENSQKVLRIAPRFEEEGVHVNEKGEIERIEPLEFYTKYGFIPNPDGSFYDIGFGRLLGPINDACDTLTNQLIDAGTLANLQGGFIGKGLRIKMGDSRFSPGEWKAVNATGDDIRKQIVPLPAKDPSNILLELLKFLIESGNKLASVAEIFVGKMPGQNTPATTTMASIEQGMKVFTAVYKRVYRALTEEFRKLYKLNGLYLDQYTDVEYINEVISQDDFKYPETGIVPTADPNAVSSQEKQAKAQSLMQILQLGTLDPMAVTQLYLDAFEIITPEKYLKQPEQGPSPEQQQMEQEAHLSQQEAQAKMQQEERKAQLKEAETTQKLSIERAMAEEKLRAMSVTAQIKAAETQNNHAASMQQQHEKHTMSMHQAAQKAKQTPKKDKK